MNLLYWKIIILFLKIIAYELRVVLPALRRQRQPGQCLLPHKSLVTKVLLCLRPALSYLTMRMASFGSCLWSFLLLSSETW